MLCFTQQPLKKCHRIHKCEGKQQYCTGKGTQLQKICTLQGRIQDFKLGGGALKKIAPSGGRRENCWGIPCEKSRFYATKSYFSNFRGGRMKFLGYFMWKITILPPKNHIFSNFRGGARRVRAPSPLNPPLHCQNLNKKKKKKFWILSTNVQK